MACRAASTRLLDEKAPSVGCQGGVGVALRAFFGGRRRDPRSSGQISRLAATPLAASVSMRPNLTYRALFTKPIQHATLWKKGKDESMQSDTRSPRRPLAAQGAHTAQGD